jgi:hypothetical protein
MTDRCYTCADFYQKMADIAAVMYYDHLDGQISDSDLRDLYTVSEEMFSKVKESPETRKLAKRIPKRKSENLAGKFVDYLYDKRGFRRINTLFEQFNGDRKKVGQHLFSHVEKVLK